MVDRHKEENLQLGVLVEFGELIVDIRRSRDVFLHVKGDCAKQVLVVGGDLAVVSVRAGTVVLVPDCGTIKQVKGGEACDDGKYHTRWGVIFNS